MINFASFQIAKLCQLAVSILQLPDRNLEYSAVSCQPDASNLTS